MYNYNEYKVEKFWIDFIALFSLIQELQLNRLFKYL